MTGTEQELLPTLVKDNVLLKAQFKALRSVFKVIVTNFLHDHPDPRLNAALIDELYKKAVLVAGEKEILQQPLMEESVKSFIQDALQNVPGLTLTKSTSL